MVCVGTVAIEFCHETRFWKLKIFENTLRLYFAPHVNMSTCVSLTSSVSDVKSGNSLDNYITILIGEVEMKSINQIELILIIRWKLIPFNWVQFVRHKTFKKERNVLMMHVSVDVPHFSHDSRPIRVWEIISWTQYLCNWPVDWLWVSDKYESEERGWEEAAWVQCPEARLTEVRARPRRAQVTVTDVHLVFTESIIIMVTMWSLYVSAIHYYYCQLTSCHRHVFSVRVSGTDWTPRAAPQAGPGTSF